MAQRGPGRAKKRLTREHSGTTVARDEVSGEEQGAERGWCLRAEQHQAVNGGSGCLDPVNRLKQGDQRLGFGVRPGVQFPLGPLRAKSDKTPWAHL